MTTIAYDGQTIAADGQWTASWGVVLSMSCKKIRVVDHKIYAITGNAAVVDAAIAWHRGGADPDKAPKGHGDGWTLIVVDAAGLVTYTDTMPYPSPVYPTPVAFGAGCEVALAAMLCGKSPRDAVALTSQICTHTGGDIQVVDAWCALGRVPEAAE